MPKTYMIKSTTLQIKHLVSYSANGQYSIQDNLSNPTKEHQTTLHSPVPRTNAGNGGDNQNSDTCANHCT